MNPEAAAIAKWLKSQGYFISLTYGMVSSTGERRRAQALICGLRTL
jgi:hypothetical protein